MKIEMYHASKFGNGEKVAEEFKKVMASKDILVNIHHISEIKPKEVPAADLYVFSSPGRMGKPIKGMRKFIDRLQLPSGTRYALLVTEMNPQPNKVTGEMPTEEELGKCQRVMPIMNEMLQAKGYTKVAEQKIFVLNIKGPLEDGWQRKVEEFAAAIPISS